MALHRFLKTRICDYDYEQHFGGVYYLFLRGIEPNSDAGIFNARPTKAMIENLDALISGELNAIETENSDTNEGNNQQMGLGF
ncbi:exodeoxyribonuclease V beta chain [Vibrio maritimus]|uniref:Exodeoxyribonuclease V beta chain n=1 Tax=Vibrio maritimus TaxID=990268 RepID=A0A090TPD8_9VIBR|nr:exodeoxyribonuclease V beta chain [Vibrio maritimus]